MSEDTSKTYSSEEFSPEDLNQMNMELYQLSELFDVGLHEANPNQPYTKAEVQQVREAYDKALFAAGFGVEGGNSPQDVLVEGLLHKKDGSQPSEQEINLTTKLVNQADANIIAMGAVADSLSEQVNTVKNASIGLSNLAMVFDVRLHNPDPSNPYTKKEVAQVREAYNGALAEAGIILNEGLASGDLKQPAPPFAPLTKEGVLIALIADKMKGIIPPDAVKRTVENAENYMSTLDVVAGNVAENAQSNVAIGSAITKIVATDINGNEVASDPRIVRLEKALAQIVPELNTLADVRKVDIKPVDNITIAGNNNGFYEQDDLESYKGAIRHLNFLVEFDKLDILDIGKILMKGQLDDVKNSASDHLVSGNVDAIKVLLKDNLQKSIDEKIKEFDGLTNDAEKRKLFTEINDLKDFKANTVDQVFKDIASLEQEGLLNKSAVVTTKTITTSPAPVDASSSPPSPTPVDASSSPPSPAPVDASSSPPSPTPVDASSSPPSPTPVDASILPVISDDEIEAMMEVEKKEAEQRVVDNAEKDINGHVQTVKEALFALRDKIEDFDGIGLSEAIVEPITLADVDAEGFGDNFQDLFAKAVVLVKTLDNEGKPEDKQDKNPNGVYSPAVGQRLKFHILTNPMLESLRDEFHIEQMAEAEIKAYFGKPPAGSTPEQIEQHEAGKIETDKKLILLDGFIESLDEMKRAKKFDEDLARSTTKMNIMLDGMFLAMDKWAPGMSGMLEKFFTGSEFGKMIGGILSMFGINVNRLWGDKEDKGVEASRPLVDKGFDLFVEGAESKLGDGANFADVMGQAKQDMLDRLKNSGDGFADKFKKSTMDAVLNKIFDGKGEEFIEEVVSNAMDAAITAGEMAGGDYEVAKTAFADSLIQAGEDFQKNNELTIDKMDKSLRDTATMAQGEATQDKKYGKSSAPNQGSSATPASVVAGASASDVINGPTVDMDLIAVGENMNVGLVFEPDSTQWYQGNLRLSNGEMLKIQEVLGDPDNHEALGLTISPEMIKIDGKFSDMATPNTNAIIEETVIRAQVFALVEGGAEITQEILDGIDRKLSLETLDVVKLYMSAKGVKLDDIDKLSGAVTTMDEDFYSTKLEGNPRQDVSVLDQVLFDGQFKVTMAQFGLDVAAAPVIENVPEEIDSDYQKYLDYNKDRPCDIPMFFTKKGSDSAFVAIIDKNGTPDDTSDDEFKVHEIKGYLDDKYGRSINDPNILKALQDNYDWTNSTKQGIESFVNKVLCLEGVNLTIDTPEVKNTKAEESTAQAFNVSSGCNYNDGKPETFTELCLVTEGQAAIIKDKGLDIELMAKQAFEASPNSEYVIMDLAKFNIKGEELPDVVVIKNWGDQYKGSLEIKAVDYNLAGIKPLEDQYRDGLADMKQFHTPPYGGRRLDTILSIYKINSGGRIDQGATGGYPYMMAVVPNSNGDGAMIQNAMQGVYGDKALTAESMVAYNEGQSSRWYSRSGYVKAMENAELTGSPAPESVVLNAGQEPQQSIPPVAEQNLAQKIKYFANNLFGGDDSDDISAKIDQNTDDMGASNDDDGFWADENYPFAATQNSSPQAGVGATR